VEEIMAGFTESAIRPMVGTFSASDFLKRELRVQFEGLLLLSIFRFSLLESGGAR
jgi:hypothetical protein